MAAFGIKAIHPSDNPHILGFASARTGAGDPLLEIWNGPTVGSRVWWIDKDGNVTMAGTMEINGVLNHDGSQVGFFGTAPVARQTGYTAFANLVTDRTCDADATTVAELADILGTLIEDLKALGLIAA